MSEANLLHELPLAAATRDPTATALTVDRVHVDYAALAGEIERFAGALCALGVARGDRIAIWLEKRRETVVASFGAAAAGCAFVPVNPLLKAPQVAYILGDCDVRVLVTSAARLSLLAPELADGTGLAHVVVVDDDAATVRGVAVHRYAPLVDGPRKAAHRVIDTDVTAILYTSGSTGRPKGVVLSHRNMVAGAKSVASYLGNRADDALLAVLPLSFDAGFSQLTTAFHAGARAVLLNYLVPKDVLGALSRERITGLTAVPPLYIQLAQLTWPEGIDGTLRYFANTGGRMPRETLTRLRERVPRAEPFLMYGLTEAFRSTYLPPTEVDRRPDSIGKAIPNAEILVLRPDGTECDADEPGELVHRGALVGMGYWNDQEKTAERYRPLPRRADGLVLTELAVFSGDTVRRDAEGFLYFIGRRDEMIKSSGYRISPTEVEEALYATQQVGEVAAFGVPHPQLGQAVMVVATPADGSAVDVAALNAAARARLPAYMVPARIEIRAGPLPRNANGKIDRKAIAADFESAFERTP
jgi:acyl-CoA ligase (AMP-forming) (exosortase A-associated)